jgi:capsular polysaccharide transport system permease protein
MSEVKEREGVAQDVTVIPHKEPIVQTIELSPIAPPTKPDAEFGVPPDEPRLASIFRRYGLFLVLVALPVFVAILYFGFIASPVYISETRFIVRAAAGGDAAGLQSIVQSGSLSRAVDETYAVNEYIQSFDVVDRLTQNDKLRDILSRPEADFLSRFPSFFGKDTKERLLRSFKQHVTAQVDSGTGISTLEVRAFRPEDAQALAQALLKYAEDLINALNERAHQDAVKYAQKLVDENTAKLAGVQERLSGYRNRSLLVDPEKEAANALGSLTRLSTEISRLEAQLAQQKTLMPNSPALNSSRERLKSYQDEFEKQRRLVVGDKSSIAAKMEGYEALALERELSVKALTSSVIELEKARQDAQLQRLYLQSIVDPNLPDEALLPRRLLMIIFISALSFCLFWIVRSFANTVREHRA